MFTTFPFFLPLSWSECDLLYGEGRVTFIYLGRGFSRLFLLGISVPPLRYRCVRGAGSTDVRDGRRGLRGLFPT